MRWMLIAALCAVGCGDKVAPTTALDSGAADATPFDTNALDTKTADTRDTPLIDSAATTDTTSTPPDTTSTPPDTAMGDGDVFGSGCNDLLQKGSPVTQTGSSGPVPAFTGGTIADGTYVMTKWIAYGGKAPSPTPVRETILIKGSVWQIVADTGAFTIRSNAAVSTSGTTINYVPSCPAGGMAKPSSYSATATELIAGDLGATDAAYFTKL